MSATHVPEVRRTPQIPMMPGRPPYTPELGDDDDNFEIGDIPDEDIVRNIRQIIRKRDESGERPTIDPRDEPDKIIN